MGTLGRSDNARICAFSDFACQTPSMTSEKRSYSYRYRFRVALVGFGFGALILLTSALVDANTDLAGLSGMVIGGGLMAIYGGTAIWALTQMRAESGQHTEAPPRDSHE